MTHLLKGRDHALDGTRVFVAEFWRILQFLSRIPSTAFPSALFRHLFVSLSTFVAAATARSASLAQRRRVVGFLPRCFLISLRLLICLHAILLLHNLLGTCELVQLLLFNLFSLANSQVTIFTHMTMF